MLPTRAARGRRRPPCGPRADQGRPGRVRRRAEAPRPGRRSGVWPTSRSPGRGELVLATGHRWSRTRSTVADVSAFLLELREVAESGAGAVLTWCDEPSETQPAGRRRRSPTSPGPGPPEPGPLSHRRDAAHEVLEALAGTAEEPSAAALAPHRPLLELLGPGGGAAAARSRPAPARRSDGCGCPATCRRARSCAWPRTRQAFAASLARPLPRRPSRAARAGTEFHAWLEEHLGSAAAARHRRARRRRRRGPARRRSSWPRCGRRSSPASSPGGSRWRWRRRSRSCWTAGCSAAGSTRSTAATAPDGSPGYEVVDWKTGRTGAPPRCSSPSTGSPGRPPAACRRSGSRRVPLPRHRHGRPARRPARRGRAWRGCSARAGRRARLLSGLPAGAVGSARGLRGEPGAAAQPVLRGGGGAVRPPRSAGPGCRR